MDTPESAIPREVQLFVWRRDQFRCGECGVAVGGRHGCKPQTHHMVPKAAGGTDDPSNLITLCFPCHATKPSPGHLQLLDIEFLELRTAPVDLDEPEFLAKSIALPFVRFEIDRASEDEGSSSRSSFG